MPTATKLGTVINLPAPPQIDIEVSNGGGGTGDTALVSVHVVWDPTVMSFDSITSPTARTTVTESSCTWSGYGIPWASSKTFSLVLYRKAGITTDTKVIATPTDTRSGDYDTRSISIPAGHPQEP